MLFYHLIFVILDESKMNEQFFEASKIYENILDAPLKYAIIFQCYFDTSKMTLNYNSIFPRRVENVQDASPKYATICQCYFGCVMQIFDVSKMTFMTPPPE